MTAITQLLCNKFGGIRNKNAIFSEDLVSAQDIQNVELYYTGMNNGVGIRTAKGNAAISKKLMPIPMSVYEKDGDEYVEVATDGTVVDNGNTLCFKKNGVPNFVGRKRSSDTEDYYGWNNDYYTTLEENEQELQSIIPADETIMGIFQTVQSGIYYFIIYTESTLEGKLYHFNTSSKSLTLLADGLEVTGKACATDFAQGWVDVFVFSNGEDLVYIYSDASEGVTLQKVPASSLHLVDGDERTVKGLGLKVFDSRLWVFDGKVLWYSEKENCYNFTPSESGYSTDAGYIEFVKDVTAIYPYLGALAVFHKDSSTLITLDSTTIFKQDDESPGGCASYNSLVFHGTGLYFYDDTKKGVFSFQQVVNGDKTLGDNIAIDIQHYLMDIESIDVDKIKAISVVTDDRNEVWFIVPIEQNDETHSTILIYDYNKGEWIRRKSQKINDVCIYNNTLYSGGKDIYEEYSGKDFDGEYIQHYYNCSPMNLGATNTLKILVFPPRVSFSFPCVNKFYVKYVKDFRNFKKPKIKLIKTKIKNYMYWGIGIWGVDYWVAKNTNVISKFPNASFRVLEISIYTQDKTDDFAIKNMEFSKIKVKQI